MRSAMIRGLLVALTGAGPAWSASPELFREAEGEPVVAAFYNEWGGPKLDPALKDPAAAAARGYDGYLAENYRELGLVDPADRFPLEASGIVTEAGEDLPPGTVLHGVTKARLTPIVGGSLAFVEGSVTVTFVRGELTSVMGRSWPARQTEAEYGWLIEAAAALPYQEARERLRPACEELYEPHAGVELISLERQFRYYRFGCDDHFVDVDSLSGEVRERFPAYDDDWRQFPPTASVRGMTDGGRLPGLGLWMYDRAPASNLTEIFSGIRVDRWEPATAPCRFRLSVHSLTDGGLSVFPFPTTVLNGSWAYRANGDCGTAAGAFTNTTATLPAFHAQNVHVQAERMAHIAARDEGAALFRLLPSVHQSRLRVQVATNDPGACGGNAGRYTTFNERACINTSVYREGWWTVPHEYAHYVSDMYDSYFGLLPSCRREAVTEGIADALSLSLIHRRHDAGPPFSGDELTWTFLADPGLTRDSQTVRQPYVSAGLLCAQGSKYVRGLVLSEIMWKLVNARRCESRTTCAAPAVLPDRIRFLGREAFTLTMTDSGHGSVALFAREWFQTLRALFRGEGALNADLDQHLLQIFAQHDVL
jgi:hypothetical protein